MNPEVLLSEGALGLGVELTPEMLQLFMRYLSELKAWNTKINLTSLRDDREIVIGHFLDSISAVRFMPEKGCLLDIGSGAGFPGMPIKLVIRPLEVMLIDSSHKKTAFMREIVRVLGLDGVNIVCGRAEDERNGIERRSFDRVITRAVGPIPEILRLSEPYLAPAGRIILMRGRRGGDEWAAAGEKVKDRFKLVDRNEFTLPYDGQSRAILAVELS